MIRDCLDSSTFSIFLLLYCCKIYNTISASASWREAEESFSANALSWAKILLTAITFLTAFSLIKFLKVLCGTFADDRNALIDKS